MVVMVPTSPRYWTCWTKLIDGLSFSDEMPDAVGFSAAEGAGCSPWIFVGRGEESDDEYKVLIAIWAIRQFNGISGLSTEVILGLQRKTFVKTTI